MSINKYPILQHKFIVSIFQFILTVGGITLVELGKLFPQPIPTNGTVEFIDNYIFLIVWIFQWFFLFPFGVIISILMAMNYHLKIIEIIGEIFDELLVLLAGIAGLILFLFLYIKSSILQSQTVLYIGISPEILIGTIISSLILILFPLYWISRPYRRSEI